MKAFEYSSQLIFGNADPGTPDRYMDVFALVRANVDTDAAAGFGKFDGVVQQIDQHLTGAVRVCLDNDTGGQFSALISSPASSARTDT